MAKMLSDLERIQLEQEIEMLTKERIRRLTELMERENITYVRLGELTGVAKSSIQRYLTGQTVKIPIDFFEKVAKVTNTPVDYLTCFDIQKNTSIGEDRGDFEAVLSKLNEQEREQVMQYAKFISGNK